VASAKWDQLVEHLAALGVLSFIDGHVLHRYCVLYSRWSAAEEVLRTRGDQTFPVRGKDGQIIDVRVYPEVYIAARLFDQLLKIEDRFGLSPASRVSLRTKTVMDARQREEENAATPGNDVSRFFN
jgi:P27 family predicted phage terminase small subunit